MCWNEWKINFPIFYFSSYGHFCTQNIVNFLWIFTYNSKNKNCKINVIPFFILFSTFRIFHKNLTTSGGGVGIYICLAGKSRSFLAVSTKWIILHIWLCINYQKLNPSNRIWTSDLWIAVYHYSPPLYQLSYRRYGDTKKINLRIQNCETCLLERATRLSILDVGTTF